MKDFVFATYGVGTSAYYDAFIAGMIPCKVIEITDAKVIAVITKDVGAWKNGEKVSSCLSGRNGSKIVPRDRRYLRGYFYRINTQFEWKNETH